MIRVPVKTKKGVYRVMRTRVPRTRTFELYRRAQEEAPELLKQIYAVISRDVEALATDEVHRSTVLMSGIPSDQPFQKTMGRFLRFRGTEEVPVSNRFSGPYFFDRQETWETTWPDKGRIGAEYVREVVKPSEAREPGFGPRVQRASLRRQPAEGSARPPRDSLPRSMRSECGTLVRGRLVMTVRL